MSLHKFSLLQHKLERCTEKNVTTFFSMSRHLTGLVYILLQNYVATDINNCRDIVL